jgi:hypothetical protein
MDNQANCPLVLRANRPSIDPVYFGLTDFRGNEFSDCLALRTICTSDYMPVQMSEYQI